MSEATTHTIRVQKDDFIQKVKKYIEKKSKITTSLLIPGEKEGLKEAQVLIDFLSYAIDDVVIISREDFERYY